MVDLRAAAYALAGADLRWIALAVALALLAPVLVAAKVRRIVDVAGLPRPFGRCWSAVMATLTLNALLPGRSGDLVRAVFLADDREEIAPALGAVLVERLLDVGTLGAVALVASLWAGASAATAVALGAVVASLVAILAVAQGRRLPVKRHLATQVGRAAAALLANPGAAAFATAMSLLCWLDNVAVIAVCLRAVGGSAPLDDVARAAPIAILAGTIPVTIGGIGTRDATLVLLLSPPTAAEHAAAAAFLYTAHMGWFLAAIGILSLGGETLRRVRAAVGNVTRGA
jgi:uncharacterized membrane protein YbhN (UPF0104 family)